MRIQHNIMAMSAYRNYNTNTSAVAKNLEKLSSGYKINRAGDDAAGLAISEKMRAQITGLNAAQKNVKDGISLVKTAEGAMQEMQDMLNRMDYLATQSANGTYDNEVDRKALQDEVDQLLSEINRIADSSNFNGIKLLDGTLGMSEAFSTGTVTNAVEAGVASTLKLTYSSSTASTTHINSGVTQVPPEFTIDLSKLTISGSGSATLTLTIGTQNFKTAKIKASAGIGTIASEFGKVLTGATDAKALKVFNSGSKTVWMKASVSGNKLVFKFAGVGAKASAVATDGIIASAAVASFDALIGAEVKIVSSAASKVNIDSNAICDITAITRPVPGVDSAKIGISVTVDNNFIKDGNKITIGTKSYYIKNNASGSNTAVPDSVASANIIDLTKVKDANKIKEAIAQLTNKSDAKFVISGKGTNELHIDMISAASADRNKYKTYDGLKGIITAEQAAAPAKNASIELNVSASKIKNGDTLQVGSKTYTFNKGNTIDDVMNAIKADFNVEKNGTKLIISSKTANSTVAPSVLGKGLTLQIGDTADNFNQLGVTIKDMHADTLGVGGLQISDQESAAAAIQTIKNAINTVSSVRGTLGATQNRLEHTANNLSVMAENIQDAESSIRDTDIAEEMMSYTKNNILVQSAQAMLAQANQVPQGVLQLLG